ERTRRHLAGRARPRLRPGSGEPGGAGPDRARRLRGCCRRCTRGGSGRDSACGPGGMADPARHRSARAGPVARQSAAIGGNTGCSRSSHRARRDGDIVQSARIALAGLAGAGGPRMTASYRDATAADLPAIDHVFRTSFYDTFAHLYRPEDLAQFLDQFTPEAWAAEFSGPGFCFRVAEVDGEVVAFVKLGPSSLPIESSRRFIELRQIYVLKDHHGTGLAKALTDWAIEE